MVHKIIVVKSLGCRIKNSRKIASHFFNCELKKFILILKTIPKVCLILIYYQYIELYEKMCKN